MLNMKSIIIMNDKSMGELIKQFWKNLWKTMKTMILTQ